MPSPIQRATVIGAGTMGAQIAALLAGIGIPTCLLDMVPRALTPEEEAKGLTLDSPAVRNRIVNTGLERAKAARPPAFFTPDAVDLIELGNLEDDFGKVGEADWVIESIVEDLDAKRSIMARVETACKPGSIVTTNTSGLSLRNIVAGRSDDLRARFLGTHFFNPPRHIRLLEIVPTAETRPEIVQIMQAFGERALGKGVVLAKDTPNFIANRLASMGTAFTLDYALEHGYTVEEVDVLTGPLIGRPKSGTFRLQDLVGVDVATRVAANLYQAIEHDERREVLHSPRLVALRQALIQRGWLGGKTGQGFYKEVRRNGQREYWVLDLEVLDYRPPEEPDFPEVGKIKDISPLAERLRALLCLNGRAGELIRAIMAYHLSYAALRLPEIADDIVSIDSAVKWGFAHELGPFEIWDVFGVPEMAARIEARGLPVATWVREMLSVGQTSFYVRDKGGRPSFYDRSIAGHKLLWRDPRTIDLVDLKATGGEIRHNASASLIDLGDGVACLEFHSKMNALDGDILELLRHSLEAVEREFVGLVIGNQGREFCAGANLATLARAAQDKQWEQIEQRVRRMQAAMMAVRYSPMPVVVAPFGMTLGGGAEVAMAGARICAVAETHMGLVEFGVGLIPGGGGCKEMLRRLVSPVARVPSADPLPFLRQAYQTISQSKVSDNAAEAMQMGFLARADRIVMNPDHLLTEAKQAVLELERADYRPPARGKAVYAFGQRAMASLHLGVYQMRQGDHISDHDALIARKLAHVLCGGGLTSPQWVNEEYILDLEREAFLSLCGEPKTVERMWHMLQTGKPLRN